MRAVCELLNRVADATVPVLLLGETGTGKSLLARALHAQGRRAAQRFVTINCAALPEALLESELFGHLKGSFSGATADRPGLFVDASGGTLLLDEVAEMSLGTQAKLLDVVERGVVRPVGGDRERRVDVRLVAATHRDLRAEVRAGRFREDLLYRLNVVALEVPALRDRRADIPLLAELFLGRARAQHPHSKAQHLSASATRKLVAAAWPGNVRELQHAIERAVLLANDQELRESDFSPDTLAPPGTPIETGFSSDVIPMKAMQRRYARWALGRVEGRKMIACEKLEIDPKTLNRLLDDDEH
jgi:two-component system response regulator HydG